MRQLVLNEFDVQLETTEGLHTTPAPQPACFDYYASQDDAPALAPPPLPVAPTVGSSEGLGVFAMFDDLAGVDFDQSGGAQPDAKPEAKPDASPPKKDIKRAPTWAPPAGLFITASNKPAAAPSDAAMKRAAALFGDLLTDDGARQEQHADDHMRTTATAEASALPPQQQGHAAEASTGQVLGHAPAILPTVVSPPLEDKVSKETPLFLTGSGRAVHVSEAALCRAAALLGDHATTPVAAPTVPAPPPGLFVTASGKHHTVSDAAMQRAQSLLGDVLLDGQGSDAPEAPPEGVASARQTPLGRGRGARRTPSLSTGARKRFRSPLLEGGVPSSAAPPRRTRFAEQPSTTTARRAVLPQRPLRRRLLALKAGVHPPPDASSAPPTLTQLQAQLGAGALGKLRGGLLAAGALGDVATEAWVQHHAWYAGVCF